MVRGTGRHDTVLLTNGSDLLEATDLGIDAVADRAGMGTAASLRSHLRTHVGVSPVAYRRRFRAPAV